MVDLPESKRKPDSPGKVERREMPGVCGIYFGAKGATGEAKTMEGKNPGLKGRISRKDPDASRGYPPGPDVYIPLLLGKVVWSPLLKRPSVLYHDLGSVLLLPGLHGPGQRMTTW